MDRPASTSRGLVGRSDDLSALHELIVSARSGRSGVLVVHGEPGVGKTALVRSAVEAAQDFRVLSVAGVEAEFTLGFAALHRLLGPLLDDISVLPAAQHRAHSLDPWREENQVESIDLYRDIERNNAEVIRVAWRGPDNLVPVAPGSFVTWVDDRDSAHVAFTHKDTGELFAGDADDIRGLVWLEDGEVRVSSLG